MKVSQANTLSNLHKSFIGRLKLNLFQEITGGPDKVPSNKQTIAYIKKLGSDYYPFLKFYTYLLTDGSHRILNSKDLVFEKDITNLLIALKKSPLTDPALFEINDHITNKEICIWIDCTEMEEGGYWYNIIIYGEEHFPNALLFYAEINTGNDSNTPTIIHYWDSDGKHTIMDVINMDITANSFLNISIKLMGYIEAHLYPGAIVNLSKAVELGKKSKTKSPFREPVDKKMEKLIKEVLLGKASCVLAEIPLKDIVPFSYDFCFRLPLDYIYDTAKYVSEISQHGMIVYWNGSHFIMNVNL